MFPSPFIDSVKFNLGLLWSIIDIFQLKHIWNINALRSPKLMHVLLFFMRCPLQLVFIVIFFRNNLIQEFICMHLHNQVQILMRSFNLNQLIQTLIFKFCNMLLCFLNNQFKSIISCNRIIYFNLIRIEFRLRIALRLALLWNLIKGFFLVINIMNWFCLFLLVRKAYLRKVNNWLIHKLVRVAWLCYNQL